MFLLLSLPRLCLILLNFSITISLRRYLFVIFLFNDDKCIVFFLAVVFFVFIPWLWSVKAIFPPVSSPVMFPDDVTYMGCCFKITFLFPELFLQRLCRDVLLLFLDVTDEETTEEKMSKWLSERVFDGCWWYWRKRSKWEVTAISVLFFSGTEARPWVNWESISYDRKESWYDRLPHQKTGRYSAHDLKTFKDRKWHHHQCHWLYWLTLIHWEWLQNEYICQGRIIISISQPLIGYKKIHGAHLRRGKRYLTDCQSLLRWWVHEKT